MLKNIKPHTCIKSEILRCGIISVCSMNVNWQDNINFFSP